MYFVFSLQVDDVLHCSKYASESRYSSV